LRRCAWRHLLRVQGSGFRVQGSGFMEEQVGAHWRRCAWRHLRAFLGGVQTPDIQNPKLKNTYRLMRRKVPRIVVPPRGITTLNPHQNHPTTQP